MNRPLVVVTASLRALAVLAVALSPAFAQAQPRTPPTRAPVLSLRVLPSPGPASARSPELVTALRLADVALRLRLRPTSSGSLAAVNRWTRETFAPWLRTKTAAVQAAERALQVLAARADAETLVASAVVGLLYEDLAATLRHVRAPAAIASDPALADIFTAALDDQAVPLLERARGAYEFCMSRTATAGAVAEAYREACATRHASLGARLDALTAAARERQARRAAAGPAPSTAPAH